MRPYYILAPDYRHNSAGVRVLYKLKDKLEEAGRIARIVHGADDETIEKVRNENAIAVYPETVTGNPFKANTVARWVLYYPGVLAGDKVYADNELVFSYSRLYNSSIKNKIHGNLFLPDIDLNVFKDYGFRRTGTAFYIGKSKFDKKEISQCLAFQQSGKTAMYSISNSIEITSDFPSTQEGLALLLNFVAIFYCFDPSTIIIHEAEFCGCRVFLLSDNEEQHKDAELGLGGNILSRYTQAEKDFIPQLKHFIEVTQNDIR